MWLWNRDSEFSKWQHPALCSGMTCHWIRPNVRHIGILHLVSISTTSPQLTCHCAPVSEILSKSDHSWQKWRRFSKWRILAFLDYRGPIMGSYRSSIDRHRNSKLLSFWENRVFFHFSGRQTDRQTDRQTNKQMNSIDALSRFRCRERRLHKVQWYKTYSKFRQ